MSMGEPSSKLSLKLVIDKKANNVLSAEAGKEKVDFICSFLTLPVGTVTRLLSEQGMVGCLSELYESIKNLDDICLQPNEHKDIVLKPNMCNATEKKSLFKLTNLVKKNPESPSLYSWSCNCGYITTSAVMKCPHCNEYMDKRAKILTGNTAAQIEIHVASKDGFVSGEFTYILMDDLAISKVSPVGVVSFLKKLNVDMKSVEEKVVDLDMAKGLMMLKKSFQSKKVPTEVFLQSQMNGSGAGAFTTMYKPF